MLISLSLSLRGENFPRHWPSLHFLFHLPYPTRYKRHPSTRRGWRNYYFVKRFASRLNFQFDSINTRFEFAIFEIYILQLLHTKAREGTKIVPRVYNRATSASPSTVVVSRYDFDNRIIIVFAWWSTVSRFYRVLPHHVSRVTQVFGKPARRRTVKIHEARLNKGKTENDSVCILVVRTTWYEEETKRGCTRTPFRGRRERFEEFLIQ